MGGAAGLEPRDGAQRRELQRTPLQMGLEIHGCIHCPDSGVESWAGCITPAAQQGDSSWPNPWAFELAEQPLGEGVDHEGIDLESLAELGEGVSQACARSRPRADHMGNSEALGDLAVPHEHRRLGTRRPQAPGDYAAPYGMTSTATERID